MLVMEKPGVEKLGKYARTALAGLALAFAPMHRAAAQDGAADAANARAGFYEPFELYPQALRMYGGWSRDGWHAGVLATGQGDEHTFSAEALAHVPNAVYGGLNSLGLGHGYNGEDVETKLNISYGLDDRTETTSTATEEEKREVKKDRFGISGKLRYPQFDLTGQFAQNKTKDDTNLKITDPSLTVPVFVYVPTIVKEYGRLLRLGLGSDSDRLEAFYRAVEARTKAEVETRIDNDVTRDTVLDRKDKSEEYGVGWARYYDDSGFGFYTELRNSKGAGVTKRWGGDGFVEMPFGDGKSFVLHAGSRNGIDGVGALWGKEPDIYLRRNLDLYKDVTLTEFQKEMAAREYFKALCRDSGFAVGFGWQEQAEKSSGWQGFVSVPIESAFGRVIIAVRAETGDVHDKLELTSQTGLLRNLDVDATFTYKKDKEDKASDHVDRGIGVGITLFY